MDVVLFWFKSLWSYIIISIQKYIIYYVTISIVKALHLSTRCLNSQDNVFFHMICICSISAGRHFCPFLPTNQIFKLETEISFCNPEKIQATLNLSDQRNCDVSHHESIGRQSAPPHWRQRNPEIRINNLMQLKKYAIALCCRRITFCEDCATSSYIDS